MGQRKVSAAAKRLARHGTQAEIAYCTGSSQQAVSCWLSGVYVPNALAQQRIEKAYGIKARSWYMTARGKRK
jgi:transcriptional regulator with XRE-family HTH domain